MTPSRQIDDRLMQSTCPIVVTNGGEESRRNDREEARLIHVRVYPVLVHAQSVRRHPLCFEGAFRNGARSDMHQDGR
jgi:hypothetical protein